MSKLVLVMMALSLGACATTSVTSLGTAAPAKPENCEIEVLSTPPTKAFKDVCILNARGGQSVFESKSAADLIPDLKAKACGCGADAIIIKTSREGGVNVIGPADRAETSATAIIYTK